MLCCEQSGFDTTGLREYVSLIQLHVISSLDVILRLVYVYDLRNILLK